MRDPLERKLNNEIGQQAAIEKTDPTCVTSSEFNIVQVFHRIKSIL
jgi:hypothetical protein